MILYTVLPLEDVYDGLEEEIPLLLMWCEMGF